MPYTSARSIGFCAERDSGNSLDGSRRNEGVLDTLGIPEVAVHEIAEHVPAHQRRILSHCLARLAKRQAEADPMKEGGSMRGEEKITADQRDRGALVYIRQSTQMQVRTNLQSQERQYGLANLAGQLGWPKADVEVIDEDLGRTGAESVERTGFQKLRRQVAEGEVGIVFCLEASRLARNNRDWYHLLDLCGVRGTLVADQEGIYDVRDYNDRLLLGLKGTLSEAELHILKNRLVAGQKHKAKKGELVIKLPVGLVQDPDERIVLDPDENVQHTVRTLLKKFEELGSGRKVLRWMRQEGLKMPRRQGTDLFSQVLWQEPTHSGLVRLLRNPFYAGTYVYGRQMTYREIEGEEPVTRTKKLPMDEWQVVIPNAHPGYITWEQYLRNQQRLDENAGLFHRRRKAPGRGKALCQGLLRCGVCGRAMQTVYSWRSRRGGTYDVRYLCGRGKALYDAPLCQSINAKMIDAVVGEAFLKAIKPEQLELSIEEIEKLLEEEKAADRHWQLRLEKARFEVDRARRQFDRVEPEDRLVARELERRWNEKLEEHKKLEEEYVQWQHSQRRQPLTPETLARIRELASDVRGLWEAPTTAWEDRKELLRILVQQIWLFMKRDARQVEIRIVWYGDVQTVHVIPWMGAGQPHDWKIYERIQHWASQGLMDREIAERLNADGLRGRLEQPFTLRAIHEIRRRARIHRASIESGVYNMRQAATKLGVSTVTLRQWMRQGLVQGEVIVPGQQWRIRLTEEEVSRLRGGWEPTREISPVQAAKLLGWVAHTVYKKLRRGELPGRRARVGRSTRWLLPLQELQKMQQARRTLQVPPNHAQEAQDET